MLAFGRSKTRRPVWQPDAMSRIGAVLSRQYHRITLGRVILRLILLLLGLFIVRDLWSDAIVIDPISVPERYEKSGLTSQVMSTRIAQAIRSIEEGAQTHLKKDRFALSSEAASVPDVEVPGTKLSLKTIVDLLRQVTGWDQTPIVGEVVFPLGNEVDMSKAKAEITLRFVRGKDTKQLQKNPTRARSAGIGAACGRAGFARCQSVCPRGLPLRSGWAAG